MITINSIKYKSYLEMCNAYNINYKEFLQFKRKNKELGEFGILLHFIPNLTYNMKVGYVTLNKCYYH